MNTTIKNTRTQVILKTVHVLAWIIFVGLCIKTGALLFSLFASLFMQSIAAKDLYLKLDFSNLLNYSIQHYIGILSSIIIISGLKAYIFYLVIKIFLKINYINPFSTDISILISRISYVALAIGLLTIIGNEYCEWLVEEGVSFPSLQDYLGAGGEFLFFAGIIFL